MPVPVRKAPEPPPEAVDVFGDTVPLARRYADLLATTGISHGLVGPREAPRLWERHLVNCALLESLVDEGSSVVDIGSGAGLPGIVLAIARPDLHLHLVEPLLRRTTWLQATVDDLGLPNVTVHRARAEQVSLMAPVVTARAVASLDKLVAWSFPLLPEGGRLLALKGASAEQELAEAAQMLADIGVQRSTMRVLGIGRVSEPIRVIEIERPQQWITPTTAGRGKSGKGGRKASGPRPGGRRRGS